MPGYNAGRKSSAAHPLRLAHTAVHVPCKHLGATHSTMLAAIDRDAALTKLADVADHAALRSPIGTPPNRTPVSCLPACAQGRAL